MSRRAKFVIFLTCALAGILIFAVSRPEKEPYYKGRSLTDWYEVWASHLKATDEEARLEREEAATAIRQIGTNALPLLLKRVRPESNVLVNLAYRFARDQIMKAVRNSAKERDQAVGMFRILGPLASPAIPELAKLMNEGNLKTRLTAVSCLANIGEDALPTLRTALQDSQHPARAAIASRFYLDGPEIASRFGTNISSIVQPLIDCSTNANPKLSQCSVRALGWLRLEPQLTIPALKTAFQSSDEFVRDAAVFGFFRFGDEQSVRLALADPALRVQNTATLALESMSQSRRISTSPR